MANADELTHVGMEIVVQGTKLSGEVLLKILESISKLFEKNKENQDYIINNATKEGQQKIKDLVKKHKEGVTAIDDNVTKEQMNAYVKEFKKLGVDFSVVKNEKDDFSFFFSSKDANVIEKALKNIVEKKSKQLETNKENSIKKDIKIEQKEINLEPEPKEISNQPLNKEFASKEEQLDYIYRQLSPEEKKLFKQLNRKNVEALNNAYSDSSGTYKESDKYKKLAESFSEESINKVKMIYEENISLGMDKAPKNMIRMDDLNSVENRLVNVQQVQNEKPEVQKVTTNQSLKIEYASKEEQLDHIYKQLSPEEKDLFKQLNRKNVEKLDNAYADYSSTYKESDKYKKLAESFSEESTNKVKTIYEENISLGMDKAPKNMIRMDDLNSVEKRLVNEQQVQSKKPVNQKEKQVEQSQNKVSKPQEYSLRAVKEIDTKLKEEDNKHQDKKRSKELSR